MADASDSKSDVGDNVWVQVPPPAPIVSKLSIRLAFFRTGVVEYSATLRGVRNFVARLKADVVSTKEKQRI